MKKYIRILLPIFILIGVTYAGWRMTRISHEKDMCDEHIVHIPSFRLKTLQGTFFTNKDLAQGKAVVFLYFNSDCEFCQAETEDIVRNIKKFNSVQLVYVSFESADTIALFRKKYNLDKFDNVLFLTDSKGEFAKLFGISTLPSSLVYSKDGILLCKNNGAIKVNYLLRAINR